jgi:hypothetical protein
MTPRIRSGRKGRSAPACARCLEHRHKTQIFKRVVLKRVVLASPAART